MAFWKPAEESVGAKSIPSAARYTANTGCCLHTRGTSGSGCPWAQAIPLLCRPIPPIISWLFGSIPERLHYYKGRTRCLPAGLSPSAEKKAPAEVVSYPKKGPYVPKRIICFYAVMPTSSLSVEKSQVCLYLVCAVDLSTLHTLSFIQLKLSLLCFS